jgi:hypothetical protein
MEHRRRAEWRQRELSANSFAAEYGHAGRRNAAVSCSRLGA